MQDIQPDVVTAEQLVNEILRRQSSGGPGGCGTGNKPPLGHDLDLSSEDDPIEICDSRRGSMTKAMSIEEVEEEEPGCAAFANCKGSSPSSPLSEVVILDCQNPTEFQECHIRGSINVTFPAIMIRRIAAGKIDIFEKSKELKAKIANSRMTFVVYDSFNSISTSGTPTLVTVRSIVPTSTTSSPVINCMSGTTTGEGGNGSSLSTCPAANSTELSDLVNLIARKLAQNGCRVATLSGGLPLFRELFPEWIESPETKRHLLLSASNPSSAEPSPDPSRPGEVPLLGLGSLASLKIQDDPDACDSCIGLDGDDAFPVEILPNLYLGNASISSDQLVLERHSIKHILNVTPDLPNVFEDSIRYLQIPISDHWTQSMLTHFVPAIQFIDEGRSKEEGVLVHCLAGISRSVTITMAYLMYKMGLSLNEAYDLVRAKKSNISPNFHFMGQLLDFERQLQSQFLSPPALGSSPDSGIEFDRWNSN